MITQLTPNHNASMKRIAQALSPQVDNSAALDASGVSDENLPASIPADTQPKAPSAGMKRYRARIEQQVKAMREALAQSEWDLAALHSDQITKLLSIIQKNPQRVAQAKEAHCSTCGSEYFPDEATDVGQCPDCLKP